ncbi:MAG: RNA methyltransferase [Acidimicrobiales bacterium]|jgi:TrmH family RNA methyltransferase|nr:RNA methyltransferase [Acidimicrobiales bacterium]|tara:strand:- start:2886 stop:3665 length:780 start_codon:yes stop_codon:yes gene_type:complete
MSFNSQRIRRIRRLARDAEVRESEGLFVVEGPRLVEEAIDASLKIDEVILPEDQLDHELITVLSEEKIQFHLVARKIFDGLTTLRNPQAAIALVHQHGLELDDLVQRKGLLLVLSGVSDPGNCGNLIRTAEAFGASGVLFHGGVDPYNPKVVRSSAGSFFRMRFAVLEERFPYNKLFEELKKSDYKSVATAPSGGIAPEDVAENSRIAVILGNEPRGLPKKIEALCDDIVTVPIEDTVESLNVATAGAVILYGIKRSLI